MERQYDIFERFPDHSLIWRGRVCGLDNARRKLHEIATRTSNECSAMYVPTRQVVALENVWRLNGRPVKRVVIQIAYDENLLSERADLLGRRGYEVLSVLGNERAQVVLSAGQHCDLFIIGHAAPEQTRKEMVAWLRREYPKVPIVALNPDYRKLAGADFNVKLNGAEVWLSMVATAVRRPSESAALSA